MVMRSMPIRDANGRTIGTACYREPVVRCQTSGCSGAGTVLCDYPVTRRDRASTCNRRVCRGCAKAFGSGKQHFCPPHARVAEVTNPLVTICAACFTSSCAARDEGFICPSSAATRIVTVAQWKSLLSFGVIR